ncbi:hypothetical protein ACHAXR_010103 [Thalassiosira sp. AJA248-18]
MPLWRSRPAAAVAAPPAAAESSTAAAADADAAATPMSSSTTTGNGYDDGDGAAGSAVDHSAEEDGVATTSSSTADDDDDGRHPASGLGSASEFCVRNGLMDGGPAFDDDDSDGGGGESSSVPGGGGGGGTATPPLFPSMGGDGGGDDYDDYDGGGGDNSGGHYQQQQQNKAQSAGIWPPSSQEKTKKMKRDRSGNATGGGGGGGGGNVTRVDVYPNGEGYVTTPDGVTTKTMAATTMHQQQQSSSSSAPSPASPIFQFTSNTTSAAASSTMSSSAEGGGGGSHQNSGNPVTPQTATAALNFGKGFTPGAGAQGIASSPPPSASSSSSSSSSSTSSATGGGGSGSGGDAAATSSSSAHPLDNNNSSLGVTTTTSSSSTGGGNNSSSSGSGSGSGGGGPITTPEDAGETSTTLTTSPLPWQPQTQTSTCEFTHTISNYSQKRDSGCKKAEYSSITTDSHGNKWRLIIYVNGNGRASNHHLSLFLQVADAEELPFGWNKAVSYVLTLEHPQGQSLGYAKRNPDKTFKLCPKAIDWGWSQFITSDRIQQEGYVNKNTLTVRASVTVKSSSVNIDPEDAELYLKCAVEEGNASAVKICLGQEARVNCQFKDDLYTPLHTACSANNHGDGGNHGSSSSSSSNTPTNSNSSPAPGPISAGSLEVLDLLLERDADVNACNKWRETPLLIAANNGHVEAVKRLLQSGADPSLCSEAGWSALTFAAHKGYEEICGLLLAAQAPVNCRVTEDLSTPLHKACAGSKPGHVSAVQQLLEGNADVHALNKWRETPLLTAANHGQSEAVEALLRYGADPCKCTDTGWSPLSIAAYKGHDEVVRLLLEEGAPTEEDDPTLSALLQAATKGLPDTVMLLLRHGADHTVTTKKGDTALSILVEQNLIDAAVEMVTDYSASVPRCSRDRKKIQRARLLINLRLKQMQRDGTGPYCDDSDQGESDTEPENGTGRALHDDADSAGASPLTSTRSKKKKNKGGQKSIAKAEAEARAAEEALLLELEAEENAKTAKAAATETGSSKNRKKKLKKKEKERQLKLAEELVKEEEERKERESKKAKEEVEAALAAATTSKPSSVKKEKVVELTSQTVIQTHKHKKKQDKLGQNKEISLPSPLSGQNKKQAAAEAKLNLKWAEGNTKDVKPKKVREVSLPKPGESTVKKTSSTSNNHAHRNKTNPSTTKGLGGASKKAPSDNPLPSKKIPGDNPVQPKKIPGDNPVQPRKIPGDNPVMPRKIPGDNPKVSVQQQSRQNAHHQKSATPTSKNKRGWENKAAAQQPSSAPATNQKKQPKQSNHQPATSGQGNKEKSSGKKSASRGAQPSKSPPAPSDTPSPSGKGKQQQQPAARSDESTHSTANSTADSLPATPTPQQGPLLTNAAVAPASAQIQTPTGVGPKVSVDDQLAYMANDVLGFLDFDSQPNNSNAQPGHSGGSQSSSITPPPSANAQRGEGAVLSSAPTTAAPASPSISVELPSVSIYRLEKLNELFRQCSEARSSASPTNPLCVIDDRMLRVVLYRWIIRASHGTESFFDPVIPSWEDKAYLREFLQRQFISESRRSATANNNMNAIPSIEVLRDAGAAMSEICSSLAKDVVEFRSKCEQQVPSNWSDADINVAGMEEGSNVVIDWSGKSRLSIPYVVFNSLARMYVGERNKLMSAVFSAVRRHEIMGAISDPQTTNMVCHLPFQTMECLTKGLSASLETWSDAISVYGGNLFCAMFPDVDTAFGGLPPFGKEKGGGESILNRAGGSVVVVAPPENSTSSQCIRKMVDMSETSSNVPLSFGVVLTADCFVNSNTATLSVEDLRALDPRLCGEKKDFISFIEVIPAGCCSFSKSSCMFLIIQNEVGKLRFPTHPTAIDIIRHSMRSDIGMSNAAAPMMTNLPGMPGEAQFDTASFSPMPQHQYANAQQEVPLSSNPWGGQGAGGNNRGRGHRGRLFELVGDEGDTEEDQNMNNILPGILEGLGMFRTTSEEDDIEALRLMGIGERG